jgi:hypothetical protein
MEIRTIDVVFYERGYRLLKRSERHTTFLRGHTPGPIEINEALSLIVNY